MAQESPNRLVEWYLALREWAPTVPRRLREWRDAVRAEPALIWETLTVRYSVYGLAGLTLIMIASSLSGWIAPPAPAGVRGPSNEADFHVICNDPKCGEHFLITRKKNFDDFPVQCPKCKQQTGYAARRCTSTTCGGKWVVPVIRDGVRYCPRCNERLDP